MKTELVSIIIPVYNVENYLKKCVDSVINQTYNNLQIILVDDGATDSCPSLCDEYKEKDQRIEVIHKKNGGLSSARNTGLKVVKGQYIYFLDSDDYIDTDLVDKCVKTIRSDNCDIVVFNYISEDEDGRKLRESGFIAHSYITDNPEKRTDYIWDVAIQYQKAGWNVWGRFFRAELIIDHNITFPDNRIIFAEDLAYSLRVALFAEKITVIPDVMYHYVQRTSSIMGQIKAIPLEKMIKLCEDFENYAVQKGYGDLIRKKRKYIFPSIIMNEIRKFDSKWTKSVIAAKKMIVTDELRQKYMNWIREAKAAPIGIKKCFGLKHYLRICVLHFLFTNLSKKRAKNHF